jgi:hypothetical protein
MMRVERRGYAVCECCGMLAPSWQLLPWQTRVLCRKLASLQYGPRPCGRPDEQWVRGPFRYYYVMHEHAVCDSCFDYLLDGGVFAGVLRHRGKIAFLVFAAVLVALIVFLPDILPLLKSALWLEPAEN